MSETESLSSGESLAGRLLIAMPNIGDPRFEKSVIYIFAHQDSGSMGLIVNRPTTEVGMKDLLDQLEVVTSATFVDETVRAGGPVQTERGFVLHSPDYHHDESTLKVDDAVSMTATIDVLKAIGSGDGPEKSLLALGYAGWGPGQLEREIRQNGWLHCEVDLAVVFDDDDDTKWNRALGLIGVDPSMLSSAAGRA